jgi:hypothetical protein
MPSSNRKEYILSFTTKVLGFFIGVFGAAAILGVFFKIWDNPIAAEYSEPFMIIGFLGEAGAFIIMGILELVQAFFMDAPDEVEGESSAAGGDGAVVQSAQGPAPSASARKMMEKKVNDDLNVMMSALGKEIKQFGGEIHDMAGEMKRARVAVKDMRTKLSEVASGELAEDAGRLGEGMRTLGSEMEGAGSTVEEMRNDLDEMLSRFRTFNSPNGG